jgi:cobalt-zinc-cadmium efflux system protein
MNEQNKLLLRNLNLALGINALIVVIEFIGAYFTHSIGLMSDAGHNLIDQSSLFLTLYAQILSFRSSTSSRTYGYHRVGIVVALINSFILLITASVIAILAVGRILFPVKVAGAAVILIAIFSWAANLTIALLLMKWSKEDLNIRSTFWHMFGDSWVSLGVAASGGVIWLTGWTLIDPLISFLIAFVIIRGAIPILKESTAVLIESAPPEIKTSDLIQEIQAHPEVENIHDLHVWGIKPGLTTMTCHILLKKETQNSPNEVLKQIRKQIISKFPIQHLTLQLENQCCHSDQIYCALNRLSESHSILEAHLTPAKQN